MNLEILRIRLEDHFDEVYRKIWVQGSSRSNGDVLITLFPIDNSPYRMVSLRGTNEYDDILQRLISNGI